MRILLIRHGDPDYEHDTLTEKGRREAELLAKRASSLAMGSCYQSPLGRAMDTAQPCLKATGKDAEVLEWLREFPAQLDLNKDPELSRAYPGAKMADGKYLIRNVWDMAPGYWTEHEEYMDRREWRNSKVAECSDMEVVYDRVIREFVRVPALQHSAVLRADDSFPETGKRNFCQSAGCFCYRLPDRRLVLHPQCRHPRRRSARHAHLE